MAIRRSPYAFLMLCAFSSWAAADPLLVSFTGTVVPAALVTPPVQGIAAQVGDSISGLFDLSGGSIFAVTINSDHFVSNDATITHIYGDDVQGIHLDVWGDIAGMDARMELRFIAVPSAQFGCVICVVDLPSTSLLNYTWQTEEFFIRADSSMAAPGVPVLPALGDVYPVAYPSCDSSGCTPSPIYLDATVGSVSAVPEPSTLVLLGSGVATLLGLRLKTKRKAVSSSGNAAHTA